jgi:hypothetical protein
MRRRFDLLMSVLQPLSLQAWDLGFRGCESEWRSPISREIWLIRILTTHGCDFTSPGDYYLDSDLKNATVLRTCYN